MCRAKVICLGVSVLECAFSIFFFSDAIAKSSMFTGIIGVAARCIKFTYSVFPRGIGTGWTEKSRRGQYEATGSWFALFAPCSHYSKVWCEPKVVSYNPLSGLNNISSLVCCSRCSHQIPIVFSSKSFKISSYPL